ncbi:hypothetical protein DIPPA_12667 [Diplonema papillatum]|nr:hypothetical protein DIPPA_12667 [Diplonema papillatum]
MCNDAVVELLRKVKHRGDLHKEQCDTMRVGLELLEKMEACRAAAGPGAYQSVMKLAADTRQYETVHSVYHRMRSAGVAVTTTALVLRLQAMARAPGNHDLNEVLSLARPPFALAIFNALLLYHLYREDMQAFRNVMAELHKQKVKPDGRTWAMCVKTSRNATELQQTVQTAASKLRDPRERSIVYFAALSTVRRFARRQPAGGPPSLSPTEAYRLAALYHSKLDARSVRTYNELLLAAPDVPTLRAVLARKQADRIPSNPTTFDIIVKQSTGRCLAAAEAAFQQARAEGFLQSKSLFTSMMKAYYVHATQTGDDVADKVERLVGLAKAERASTAAFDNYRQLLRDFRQEPAARGS